MQSEEIRKRFIDFFVKRGHAHVPSSSLVPSDPSVLLTTAGMQQFKPYFTGELNAQKDFGSLSTVSIQKSFRTSDVDEVGDNTHLTLFEMLGNFSFGRRSGEASGPEGGYWKKEAITYAYEFITQELGLPISYVTIFRGLPASGGGSAAVPKDEESRAIWQSLGIKDIREEGMEDVFWGPTGTSGPCGPTTEIYCKNAEGKDVEIWNIVFNQFFFPGSRDELLNPRHPERSEGSILPLEKGVPRSGEGFSDGSFRVRQDDSRGNALQDDKPKKLVPLKTRGIDTGAGFERITTIMQGVASVYETDIFAGLLTTISGLGAQLDERTKRVIADHFRGACFLIADGVRPSNKEAGYVLRRLLRRILAYTIRYDIHADLLSELFPIVQKKFGKVYPELLNPEILSVMQEERKKFERVVADGLIELKKHGHLDAQKAFHIASTFGLGFELIKDMAPEAAKDIKRSDFDKEFKKHQEISRAGVEKKFGGHGLILNTGELKAANEEELKKVTRLHTVTHLMQQALRMVLGPEVSQAGSDITAERTRFDFKFDRKVTSDELREVEKIVNEVVAKDLPVAFKEMPKDEAIKTGALFFFREKYPEQVKVYYVGHSIAGAFSREFCGGPHVDHTGIIGTFKITKEESVGAGVRRIKATVV